MIKGKNCTLCGEFKIYKYFAKVIRSDNYRSQCRKCRNTVSLRYQMEKKITMYPSLYHDCSNEDCGHIWAKSKGNYCSKCGRSR